MLSSNDNFLDNDHIVFHKNNNEKYQSSYLLLRSPGGGIGRRKGLKIPREQSRAGSTPALGI